MTFWEDELFAPEWTKPTVAEVISWFTCENCGHKRSNGDYKLDDVQAACACERKGCVIFVCVECGAPTGSGFGPAGCPL